MKEFFLLGFVAFSLSAEAIVTRHHTGEKNSPEVAELLLQFADKNDSPSFLASLKKKTIEAGVKAVPVLIKVMKEEGHTDKKRWLATFAMGRIMGKKSLKFIAKFTRHPNWMLRLAGLKTLLALKDQTSKKFYLDALKDTSLIVRLQALENIRILRIQEYGKDVWQMIFHKHNYQGKKGQRKRTTIISKVIRAVGDLHYQEIKEDLFKLIQSKKYAELIFDIDYALCKLTGQKSPAQLPEKLKFWKTYQL